jgi:chromosome partitioning protein
MILSVGHTKGGVGKSLITLNLAVERTRSGHATFLLDGDPKQGSLSRALEMRSDAGIQPPLSCQMLDDARLLPDLVRQTPAHHDLLIDVGGKDSHALRAALTVSDVLLLPFGPESVEIWAIEDLLALVDEARRFNPGLKVCAILNRAKAYGRDNDEAMDIVAEYAEITLLPARLGSRSVFSNAFGMGLGVSEFRPRNNKALAEISALVNALFPAAL